MSYHRIECKCCGDNSCYTAPSCEYLDVSPGTPFVYRWILKDFSFPMYPYGESPITHWYQNLPGGQSLKISHERKNQFQYFTHVEYLAYQAVSSPCRWVTEYNWSQFSWEADLRDVADGLGSSIRIYRYFWVSITRTSETEATIHLFLTATDDATSSLDGSAPRLDLFLGYATGLSTNGSATIPDVENTLDYGGTITLIPCDTDLVQVRQAWGESPIYEWPECSIGPDVLYFTDEEADLVRDIVLASDVQENTVSYVESLSPAVPEFDGIFHSFNCIDGIRSWRIPTSVTNEVSLSLGERETEICEMVYNEELETYEEVCHTEMIEWKKLFNINLLNAHWLNAWPHRWELEIYGYDETNTYRTSIWRGWSYRKFLAPLEPFYRQSGVDIATFTLTDNPLP